MPCSEGGVTRRPSNGKAEIKKAESRNPKGHPHKVALAHQLRRETPMTRDWIAKRPPRRMRCRLAQAGNGSGAAEAAPVPLLQPALTKRHSDPFSAILI